MKEITQEEKRIKIAEACGWKRGKWKSECYFGEGWLAPGKTDTDALKEAGHVAWRPSELPDYFNDLNAMHEAEEVFPHPSSYYQHNLGLVCGGDDRMYRATAAQRAEAFGKTLNLW